jgi:hypothetical protein
LKNILLFFFIIRFNLIFINFLAFFYSQNFTFFKNFLSKILRDSSE